MMKLMKKYCVINSRNQNTQNGFTNTNTKQNKILWAVHNGHHHYHHLIYFFFVTNKAKQSKKKFLFWANNNFISFHIIQLFIIPVNSLMIFPEIKKNDRYMNVSCSEHSIRLYHSLEKKNVIYKQMITGKK